VVAHPSGWRWAGYQEIMGHRQSHERLSWRLRASSLEEVRKNLAASLGERIAQQDVKREPCWTESLAVGSHAFVKKVKPLILSRREMEIAECFGNEVWALQEAAIPYGQETGLKSGSKASN
jgi:hypothetical protein